MRFGRIWTMRGPSTWAREPVIEAEFDLEDHSGVEPADVLGDGPDTFAHLLLRLTRRLQAATGFHGGIAAVHETYKPGYVRIVFDYDEETLAKACLQAAFEWLQAVAADPSHRPSLASLDERIPSLRHLANEVRLGPSTKCIVAAALKR